MVCKSLRPTDAKPWRHRLAEMTKLNKVSRAACPVVVGVLQAQRHGVADQF